MPKRRKSKVTLPKIPSLAAATPTAQARRKLETLQAAPRAPEGPSLERLLQAGDAAQLETFSEVVEVAHGDTFEPVAVNFVRMRIDDGPLARLRDRNQLDRGDKGLNLALARAGDIYRQSFFRAGLDPLRALNPAQEVSSAYSPQGLWRCESQVLALQKFRAARAAIPEDFREALAAIVLSDREPVEVGREIGAYKDAKMAGAVALFILRRGLMALARHYGLMSAGGQLS
jgi:hypothetical protein